MSRAFLVTFATVNLCLAAAGAAYGHFQHIPASLGASIVLAFLLQFSFYLIAGFTEVRESLERRFSPPALAALLVAAAALPYLVYSIPAGVFRLPALLLLLAISAALGFLFVLAPPPPDSAGLTWQDLIAGAIVAVSVLGKLFRYIYRSPVPGLHIEVLGQIMMLSLGAMVFLSLRHLPGCEYRLLISRSDWKAGIRQFLFFLPFGAGAGLALGQLHGFRVPRPQFRGLPRVDFWMYPLLALGVFLAMYAVVALFEEFFFRGVLQGLAASSLNSQIGAQVLSSVLFGLSHLWFRKFPNWRFATLAAIAGWFYGQAYRERSSVAAAGVTHALVNTAARLLLLS